MKSNQSTLTIDHIQKPNIPQHLLASLKAASIAYFERKQAIKQLHKNQIAYHSALNEVAIYYGVTRQNTQQHNTLIDLLDRDYPGWGDKERTI